MASEDFGCGREVAVEHGERIDPGSPIDGNRLGLRRRKFKAAAGELELGALAGHARQTAWPQTLAGLRKAEGEGQKKRALRCAIAEPPPVRHTADLKRVLATEGGEFHVTLRIYTSVHVMQCHAVSCADTGCACLSPRTFSIFILTHICF